MANNPFDRTIINPREKPLSQDINTAQAQLDYGMRAIMRALFAQRVSDSSSAAGPVSGFLGDGFRVVPSSPNGMSVVVTHGIGFQDLTADTPSAIDSVLGLDDLSSYKPLLLLANTTIAVPTAPGPGEERYDIIEVRANRLKGNPTSRLVFDPSTGAFNPDTVDKTLAFVVDGSVGTVIDPAVSTAALSYKTGVPAAFPASIPTTSPGYVKIAELYIVSGVASINNSHFSDWRKFLRPSGVLTASARIRVQWNGGSPIIHSVTGVVAPPGMQIAALAEPGVRASLTVWCIGGWFTGGNFQAQLHANSLLIGTATAEARVRDFTVDVASGTDKSELATATPATTIQTRQMIARAYIDAVERDAAGDGSVTSSDLNDVTYHVQFNLGQF